MKKEHRSKWFWVFFIIGFLILLHQYVNFGVWFEVNQLHHETFAMIFFVLAGFVWMVDI